LNWRPNFSRSGPVFDNDVFDNDSCAGLTGAHVFRYGSPDRKVPHLGTQIKCQIALDFQRPTNDYNLPGQQEKYMNEEGLGLG